MKFQKAYNYKIEVIYKPSNLVERTYYVLAYNINHARNIGNYNIKKLYGYRSTKHICRVTRIK